MRPERPRFSPSRPPPPRAVPWPLVAAGTTLAALGILVAAWFAYPRTPLGTEAPVDDPAARDAVPTAPGAGTTNGNGDEQAAVEPTELLSRAKERGLAWNRDAVLVAIRAEPVVAGRVPLGADGRVEVVFAVPSGTLGPGTRVGKDRFTVAFAGSTVEASSSSEAAPTRGVADPACTANDAWRAAVASGVPSNAPTTLTYANSEKYGRAVWRAESGDDPKLNRTIDGQRCTILTR
jgi:hypothetical protein